VRTFGKYRLVEPLASGGMADVWRAEVIGAEGVVKEVALKLVRGEQQARSDFVRMFVEEARLACRLSHANVVQVFEFDQCDGQYYLAMELVRGHHLGRVVERARELGLRLGLPRALHVCAEAAKALAYVHRASEGGRPLGLVHRDVSPHNLLVSFEGEVKLADFGIARAMGLAGLTEPGTLKGKAAYMAPEQAGGGPVDARADVFALGVVLWELCAGRRLFVRDSEAATLAAVLSGPPPSPPSAWNEDVPAALDAVVLAALERDPARRTASAEELEAALTGLLLAETRQPQDWDLRAFLHRLWPEGAAPGPAAAAAGPTLVRSPAVDAAQATAATRTLPPPRAPRRRTVLRAGLALALTLAAAGAWRWRGGWGPAGAGSGAPGATPARVGSATAPPVASPAQPPEPVAPVGAGATAPGPAEGAPAPATVSEVAPASPAPAPVTGPARADARRPGLLYVNATPWAQVTVDGRAVGETPLTVPLPPGRHRVRAVHPSLGAAETTLDVREGLRSAWTPALRRD
jgi:tRNA A-37 threonylcarbamoyl transferase component Bud32